MGLQIRDDRQMQALTGLSQAQCDHLLPVFNDLYQAIQHQTYEEGVASGTRTRKPGGGATGKLPTLAEKLVFVLSYDKTYPTFAVWGTPCERVRSQAHQHLPKLAPIFYDTRVHVALMPYREFGAPEDVHAAVQGVDRLIMDATDRAYRRSQEDAKQREQYSGKKSGIGCRTRSCLSLTS